MVEAIIYLLIELCFLALAIFLIVWVLGQIGVVLPAKVVQILWVIVVLFAILLIYETLIGGALTLGPHRHLLC